MKPLLFAFALVLATLSLPAGHIAVADEGPAYPIASGHVTLASGEPAGGALVRLFLLPDPKTDRSIDVGESYELVPLATTTADDNGDYTLVLADLSAIKPSDLNDEGMANLRVDTFAAGETTAYSFTQNFTLRAVAQRVGQGTSAAQTVVRVAKPVRIPSRVPVVKAKAVREKDRSARVEVSDEEMGGGGSTHCTKTLQDDWKSRTVVGVGYHAVDGVPIDFVYSEGATTTFGVGMSASGAVGSWSVSGTKAKSSSAGINFPALTGADDSYWSTYYRLGKYKEVCVTASASGAIYTSTRYYVEPMNFAGGAVLTTPSSLPDTPEKYCVPYPKGGGMTKSTSSAVTFSTGVKSGGVVGLDFSARTGFETDAKLTFTFNKARLLCGTNGDPGDAPKQIVVRSNVFDD